MWLMFEHAKWEILPSRFVFLWPPPHWQSCYCNFIPSCSVVPELPCFLLDCHPCKHHVVWRLRQPVAIFPLPMLSEQRIYCTGRWLTNSPHLMSRAHQRLVVQLYCAFSSNCLCIDADLVYHRHFQVIRWMDSKSPVPVSPGYWVCNSVLKPSKLLLNFAV